ncbi:purine nucleoside permease [Naematelia encephala]|uniref:Purine nucleoside permease n=1 Tax=Naematelia encephala TaxID=71784 RepID=A0A1Y2ADF8_9TREE|nr:purine nucleoside permease [Naematelia encephala]
MWTSSLGLTENITLPGLSPLFPNITCSPSGDICHLTTGEAEINAACSASALVLATKEFDLTKTYFMIAGIAGVNPFTGTLGGVAIARYAVQVALGYEIDARQMPANWSTGYFLFDTEAPGQAATQIYGTELFELNTNLRDAVTAYTSGVQLNDSATAQTYRAKYDYAPANQPPSIFYGDVATSDVWFTGSILDEAFGNITLLWTNNTGDYSMTAEEDNASLEALLRGALAGLVDLSRVILIRTASDFDRPPPGLDSLENLLADAGGFTPSIENIYIAGKPIVEGIVNDWDSTFAAGIPPQDGWLYNSDDLHTLVSERKREVREYQQVAKRAARMRR